MLMFEEFFESVDLFQAYEMYCSKQVKCPRIFNVLLT